MAGDGRNTLTRAAIVTGGASGIGRALAEELVRSGVRVVVADRHLASAEQTAADIRATPTTSVSTTGTTSWT